MKSRPLLIVEDEENDVFFARRAMQKAGIQNPIHVLENGQQVVEYLKGQGQYADRSQYPLPCLIIMDLKLPCLNGPEVLSWIRKDSRVCKIPVVILSSSTLATDVDEAYTAGANAYAVKPADPEELVQLMKDFANWWLKQVVSPY